MKKIARKLILPVVAVVTNMQNNFIKSFKSGFIAGMVLLGLYFAVLTLVSGWTFAKAQFADYWYFIISLIIGFGVQIALYQYIRNLTKARQDVKKIMGITGTTSTVAMISCCSHYLVNILPILGITGLVAFAAQYQIKLFWIGIFFNATGVAYMINKIIKLKKHYE